MAEQVSNEFGFKVPDAENLLDPDPISKIMVTADDTGPRPFTPNDILRLIENVRLEEPVPLEVRRAFRMALGAMPYAYWYYPLYTMAAQQMLRVADLALDYFARTVDLARPLPLGTRIRELYDANVFSADDRERWETIRRLRNSMAHPGSTQIFPLPHAYDVARLVGEAISQLPWAAQS